MKNQTHYQTYLQIDALLSLQKRQSEEVAQPAHDETLFIITHQVYELWFKQVLTEIDSVLLILSQARIEEREMGTVAHRLERVNKIFELLIDQIAVLETMTPLDFLDFRHLLYPASGFQSAQFRELENKLGLRSHDRLNYNSESYEKSLHVDHQAKIKDLEQNQSLFDAINHWLARTPILHIAEFEFWKRYKESVNQMNQESIEELSANQHLSDEDRTKAKSQIESTAQVFEAFFDEKQFEQYQAQGQWRLSYQAVLGALLILIYRDEPLFQTPHRVLSALTDLDESMTTWRHRHALMARRMLGSKVGTGGSSGFQYLSQTADQHRIFKDFTQLTTFLIQRRKLPKLPEEVRRKMSYSI